ncbi:Nn.00g089610.m01.CDS01 [Neocucurbitaria sp. VM-36]
MSSKDNLALDLEHGVRRWDRARWISVFSSHNPTIREVTECLGLGLSASSSTTNRGIPKFDNPDYRKLSSEVTKLSKELPKERDALLDFAADPTSLDKELDELLGTYGPAIWGRDADRSCLLTPDPTKKTYNKDLFYDEPEHKEILKIHLHRWIIIKACYYIRNMKLKRPSGANEYDTLADIDGEGGSPRGTPQSIVTPPERGASAGAELDVKSINLKKRKSSAHMSLSDGEEHSASPAKRQYSTLPISRNGSPRRSLKSLYPAGPDSAENTPPLPGRAHHLSPPSGSGSELGRVHLSPLASNELNGGSRPPGVTAASALGGFTAVNTSAFTAVNTTPPIREAVREPPRASSKEPQRTSPSHNRREVANYTSPYEPASRSSTTTQHAPESRSNQSMSTASTAAQGSPAAKSPIITNGASGLVHRDSSVSHHATPAHIAPQPQQQTPQPAPPQPQQPVQTPTHVLPQPQFQSQQPPHHPPSRSNTPSAQHVGRSLAPHPLSRSNTPLAQAASNQPAMAPNAQIASAPAVQSAPTYGMQLVPTQNVPAAPTAQIPPTQHMQPALPHHTIPVHQPVLKSQTEPVQIVQPPHTIARPAVATADLRLLQCEVTAGLFTFFFPKPHSPPDEPALLTRLHTLWYHGEPIFRSELSPHYDLISKILTAWLHERQAIIALHHSLASQPGVQPAVLVDRLLAMNDLRVMRLKWKNMSTIEGLSPEDLLCMAFKVMTNTEGSDYLFKDGLDRLNAGVFEFLRSEDSKIIMTRR